MVTKEAVNILLVDDQQSRLLTYEAILGPLGHRLVTASSGVEALQRLMEREFAVILLDVSMPGMDGFETAQLIHEHPRFEGTPIIFVTGVHVTELDRLKGYGLGAVDYVYVPVVPEILRSKVAVLVELHCQRMELQRLNASLSQANAELDAANQELQREKARELANLNRSLEEANRELAAGNEKLLREIAERRRAQQELLEADHRKDDFLAILGHELRNPLAPIRVAIAILQRHGPDDPAQVRMRDLIDRQVQHMTRLIDDLLDVSRITQGKINLKPAPVDVGVVARQALETNLPMINTRKHQVVVSIPDEPLRVNGDTVRLTQVIANLVSNAAKYTPDGGRIELQLGAADGFVTIAVRDNGIGIAQEYLSHVFDLFGQVRNPRPHTHEGLGIGLALVQRIVEMHQGQVEARSAGVEPRQRVRRAAAAARAGSRRGGGVLRSGHRPRLACRVTASSWSTIPRIAATASRRCCSWTATTCARLRTGRLPWRWLRASSRRSCCSTSACRSWMATRLRGGCARNRTASTWCWSPSRAGDSRSIGNGRGWQDLMHI